ncbi:MAG: DNA-directed RNA polymerase subunit beta' [Candidatus Margulisiibacteriota bacterium]
MLVTDSTDFDYLEIGLASPDKIRYWSYGEVEKPETINYRTFKPERKGLFCEKIFGPVKDWECSCGKYRRIRYRGIVCERCGVQVTHSKVRRERMGHIELACCVSHIWFLKGIPGYMGILLDLTTRQLEEVIYYDSYIVTQVDSSIEDEIPFRKILSTEMYYELKEEHGDKFKAQMGAEAIRTILRQMDIESTISELRETFHSLTGQKKIKATKRLSILESLHSSGNLPEWMILDVIPVMPPDLRPMVQLEGGRFATSDLNDLYRRVVNRNNRLKRLLDIGAPDMIIRNEKRMLQEAVDALISNGKRGRAVTGSNGRPLKSLGNIIEGKQGRFRQNLLGKRVDYSGRSVIVVGPKLKFHQCGIPKEMALELFKPFIINELVNQGLVTNVKAAKRKIEDRELFIWDVLEKVIKGQSILLNRAPTLHRLGIQAFEPKLVEGAAIQVHPLVCTAFNADFDGDQMAVHVPLSIEAQAECRLLILSVNNILSPSNGKSIVTPTQDMILGCYFLTVENPEYESIDPKVFRTMNEAWNAWDSNAINIHSRIIVKVTNERVTTTMGRVVFNRTVQDVLIQNDIVDEPFINRVLGKKQLGDLIYDWYIKYGNDIVTLLADKLKDLGFKYATLSGISISIDDLKVPAVKKDILKAAELEVEDLNKRFSNNKITSEEFQLRSNEIWRRASGDISDRMEGEFGQLNNVFIMANSGARGNIDQVRQLAGMRGLMSDAQGRTIKVPIKSNFKEGLSLAEYFISCYGARKGLVDTALRTADSGYLTRRLVDVAQDVIITEDDCNTDAIVTIKPLMDGANLLIPVNELIEGRTAAEPFKHGDISIKTGDVITKEVARAMGEAKITSFKIRNIFTCQTKRGVCRKCYGLDLGTAKLVNLGEAIGIIAAQSIGEPGTQLTMRTFHTGGVDLRKASVNSINAPFAGTIKFPADLKTSILNIGKSKELLVVEDANFYISTGKDNEIVILPKGSILQVKDGQKIKKDDVLAQYDSSSQYAVSNSDGHVRLFENDEEYEIAIYDQSNEQTIEVSTDKVSEFKKFDKIGLSTDLGTNAQLKSPALFVSSQEKTKSKSILTFYPINVFITSKRSDLFVKDGSKVNEGDILFREYVSDLEASKTKDIVQGLPRVEELFEARKPKNSAVLSEFDGIVEFNRFENYYLLAILSETGDKKEYKLPIKTRFLVYSGQSVAKGQQITDGIISPQDLLLTKGVVETQLYLINEIQKVYFSQGVFINLKHLEVIVRQMTRKVVVQDGGDSTFLPNELIDIKRVDQENKDLLDQNKTPISFEGVLLGITRSSLNTESFISASSFQETARVLTEAAIRGKKDTMYGLKENVIIGKLIPAGTGLEKYKNIVLRTETGEETRVTEEDRLFIKDEFDA